MVKEGRRPGADDEFADRAAPDQAGISLAPPLAKVIVAAVVGGFALVAFIRVLVLHLGPWQLVESLAYLSAALAIQLFYFSWRADRARSADRYAALLVQACLTYLPILQFKQAWVVSPGFLTGAVLLL